MLIFYKKYIRFVVITCIVPTVWLFCRVLQIKFKLISSERIGHLALNSDLFLKRFKAGLLKANKYILVGPGSNNKSISNTFLYKIFKREFYNNGVFFIDSPIIYKLLDVSRKKLKYFGADIDLEMNTNEVDFSRLDQMVYLSEEEKLLGFKLLDDLGVKRKDKIVCIFARDGGYLSRLDDSIDWDYHNYRDADIHTYIPSIEYLVGLGYYVIRIGDHSSIHFDYENNNFIDYSKSKFKNDFLDIFLIYASDFVVGTTSGITDVSEIFNVPYLGVNYAPFIESPLGKKDMFIQKTLINKGEEQVSFPDALKMNFNNFYNGIEFSKETGLSYVDNTEDEILLAVKEMVNIVKNNSFGKNASVLQNKYDLEYRNEYFKGQANASMPNFWLEKHHNIYF